MIWISFFPGKDYHRMPRDGQKVIYYGEPIGVWRGTYKRAKVMASIIVDFPLPFLPTRIFVLCLSKSISTKWSPELKKLRYLTL